MQRAELWLIEHAASSLRRILPRIESRYGDQADPSAWAAYIERVKRHFPRLFSRLHALYGAHYDFFFHLESILASATEMWLARSAELKALDGLRETDPHWFQSNRVIGAMCYVFSKHQFRAPARESSVARLPPMTISISRSGMKSQCELTTSMVCR